MDQEIKQKWIDALRSGEFKQGTGALRPYPAFNKNPESFCCLGVLCEIYRKEHPETAWKDRKGDGPEFLDEVGVLPREVGEWAGIVDEGGWPIDDPALNGTTLTFLNDGGADFNYIADQIEKYL